MKKSKPFNAAAEMEKVVFGLSEEIDDLRQRLIGGVEGVKALEKLLEPKGAYIKKLAAWAKVNDRYLRKDHRNPKQRHAKILSKPR